MPRSLQQPVTRPRQQRRQTTPRQQRRAAKRLADSAKAFARLSIGSGLGSIADVSTLLLVPSLVFLAYGLGWLLYFSKTALNATSQCELVSMYRNLPADFIEDGKRHCATAARYYAEDDKPYIPLHLRKELQVANPQWVLRVWGVIEFVLYAMLRLIWALLMETQGVSLKEVIDAASGLKMMVHGAHKVNDELVRNRLPIISEQLRCTTAARLVLGILLFETCVTCAPLLLLTVILPAMIGNGYRTWGIDVLLSVLGGREWEGLPIFALGSGNVTTKPLFPRETRCDFRWVDHLNPQVFSYRCYADTVWHERTALATWALLFFLFIANLINLVLWMHWAVEIAFRRKRQQYLVERWLNHEDIDRDDAFLFSERFSMSNLFLLYFVEVHSDRVVTSAFCRGLFDAWQKQQTPSPSASLNATKDDEDVETAIGGDPRVHLADIGSDDSAAEQQAPSRASTPEEHAEESDEDRQSSTGEDGQRTTTVVETGQASVPCGIMW